MPQTKIEKALAGLNGGNAAGVAFLVYQLLFPVQERLTALENDRAFLCQVNASYMRSRAADMSGDSNDANDVAQGYVTRAEISGELTPVNRLRVEEKRRQADEFAARSLAYSTAAALVCQNPEVLIE